MPHAKGQPATPEQAIRRGCCPECGEDLEKLDPRGHRDSHWPRKPDPVKGYGEALIRWQMLTDYAREHPVANPE